MQRARLFVQTTLVIALCMLIVPIGAVGGGTSTGSGTWTWANRVPIGTGLQDVTFASGTMGWAVGYNGNIIATTDGGTSWVGQRNDTYAPLNGVDAVTTDDVWAVGRGGTILSTVDSGSTWTTQTSGTTEHLQSVDFVDTSDGWACGGTYGGSGAILHTANGGGNWTSQTANSASYLMDIAFADASNGMAVGNSGVMVQTTNGGTTWTPYAGTKPWGTNSLRSVQAISASHWIVAGSSDTYVSTDSGVTWARTPASTGGGQVDTFFINANTGWALSEYGNVRSTTDGGTTWTYTSLSGEGIFDAPKAIHFTSASSGVIVGDKGAIAVSADGGVTWTSVSESTMERNGSSTTDITEIEFIDTGKAIATGYGSTYWMTDSGGQYWSASQFPVDGDCDGVQFPSTTIGYAAVHRSGGYAPNILKSTDGGANWATLTHPLDDTHATYGMAAPTTSAIWVVGMSEDSENNQWAYVMHSSNGGSSFATQTINASGAVPGSLETIFALDANTAWMSGEVDGNIYYTADAGSTWTTQTAPINNTVNDIVFSDANNGWACGDEVIVHTTNGGTNWTAIDLSAVGPVAEDLNYTNIVFSDSQNGVAIGYHNPFSSIPASALITDDGGATWTLENTGANGQTHALTWDGSRYWMGGDYNSLLYRGPDIPDTYPPVTTVSGLITGWSSQDVTLTLTAVDHGSGVDFTSYQIGAGSGQTYSGPFAVAAEGSTAVDFASTDASNNVEATQTVTTMIDKTDPVTVATVTGNNTAAVNVSLAAQDNLSGVNETWYRVDSGSWTQGSSVDLTTPGDYTVYYSSSDNAIPSNVEDAKQVDVTVTDVVVPPADPTITRVFGSDRYATAVESSKANFTSAATVVLATGGNFADALAASGLAGSYDAPLLLTRTGSLPAATATEIGRLGATEVILVGGTGAISNDVAAAVDALSGVSIRRIFGATRYHTAAKIAEEIATHEGSSFAKRAFIARGDNFADALAAAPLAYSQAQPILLVGPTTLPGITRTTIEGLGITDCTVAGGTGAVSAGVVTEIDAIPGMNTPYRAFGAERYATAKALADYGVSQSWAEYKFVGIATGAGFPDGLSGGACAGASGGVLLLTRTATLSSPVSSAITTNKAAIEEVQVYGGTGAVSAGVYSQIESLLK